MDTQTITEQIAYNLDRLATATAQAASHADELARRAGNASTALSSGQGTDVSSATHLTRVAADFTAAVAQREAYATTLRGLLNGGGYGDAAWEAFTAAGKGDELAGFSFRTAVTSNA